MKIINPFTKQPISVVKELDEEEVFHFFTTSKGLKPLDKSLRINILRSVSSAIELHTEDFIASIVAESAKPRKYAVGEVNRAVLTFRIAAEELSNLKDKEIALNQFGSGIKGKAVETYIPCGTVLGVTPFNFPLNLVAHKVAPAIAAGCPIFIKPSEKTPLTAILLAKIISDVGYPQAYLKVGLFKHNLIPALINRSAFQHLSFTGSDTVGWYLKSKLKRQKCVLELGGNAAMVIDSVHDISKVVEEAVMGAFAYSGQVCIHTQRILMHKELYKDFISLFIAATEDLVLGDPDHSDISVLIDDEATNRVLSWIEEAVQRGAKVLKGGNPVDGILKPTILSNVPHETSVWNKEVFGPVVCVEPYSELQEVIELISKDEFGLQVSIYSTDNEVIDEFVSDVDYAGLIVNGPTTFRTDHTPYGGIRNSGFGREGVLDALLDFSEKKVVFFPE